MTCTEFLSFLDDLIDDTVAAPIRADIEAHMKKCGHCEVIFNTTRKTVEIYRSNEIYDLPSDLRERLHTAIMVRCRNGC